MRAESTRRPWHGLGMTEHQQTKGSGSLAAVGAAAAADHLLARLAVGADADTCGEAIGLDRTLHRHPARDQQPLDQATLAISGVALLEKCGNTLHDMGYCAHRFFNAFGSKAFLAAFITCSKGSHGPAPMRLRTAPLYRAHFGRTLAH